MKVAIVDYGLANIRSIINAFECFDVELYLAERGEQLAEADKIVLPGVGSFDAGMKGLKARGHVEALHHHVMAKKIPYLGICLGFQFIFESSAEGIEKGLGWIKGNIHCFDKNKIKVPHMGWNEVVITNSSDIFNELLPPLDVYFVHSYYAPYEGEAKTYAAGYCEYGQKYVAAVEKNNIFGVQFHPEKSQLGGMKILENFLEYDRDKA